MQFLEKAKRAVVEYGPLFIPGVLGLHYYYQHLQLFQRLRVDAYLRELSIYSELIRFVSLAPAIIKYVTRTGRLGFMAEPAFAAGMYSLITLIAAASFYIFKRKNRGGGKEEEKQTQRLEQIIAQHTGQPAKS